MRDDNHSRNYPPNDPSRRAPAGAGNAQGGDPLAELARLIGQNDPFSDFGARSGPRACAGAQFAPSRSQFQSACRPTGRRIRLRIGTRRTHGKRRNKRLNSVICARRARARRLSGRARRTARIFRTLSRRAGTGRTIRAAGLCTAAARFRSAAMLRGFDPQQSRGFDPQQFDPQQSRGSIRNNSIRSRRVVTIRSSRAASIRSNLTRSSAMATSADMRRRTIHFSRRKVSMASVRFLLSRRAA